MSTITTLNLEAPEVLEEQPSAAVSSHEESGTPSHEEIAAEAYRLWEQTRNAWEDGAGPLPDAEYFWFAAEKRLQGSH